MCVLDVMRVFTAGWRRAQGYKEGETTRQWCSGSGTVTPAWFPTCVITGTNRQTHDNMETHGARLISQDIYVYLYYLLKYSGLLDILNVQVGSTSGTTLLVHLNWHTNIF